MKFIRKKIKILDYRKQFVVPTLFILTLFVACNVIYSQTPPETNQIQSTENYRIGVGDVLDVEFIQQPILSVKGVRVNNDGTIRLQMIDDKIQAACLTQTELIEDITKRYKRLIKKPEVYVSIKEFNSNPVAFIGAVNAPGRFDVRRPTRLLELLAFVNGPSKNAGENIQIVRRLDLEQCVDNQITRPQLKENQEIILVSLEQTIKGKENANPYVQAGDIITIAEAESPDKAYIIGNIISPRELILSEPITLTQAIAMSGGVSQGAKIKRIEITRQDSETLTKSKIIVNLKEIEKGEQDDIVLRANDIIDVPGPKPSLLKDIFKGIVTTVTRGVIPIY